MKSWLTKFRISAALDAGKPLPESLRRAIAADAELERFTRRTEALGAALRRPTPVEPAMHDSIMRAVRAAARQEPPRRAPMAAWWAVMGSAVAVAAICLWTAHHRQVALRGQSLDRAVKVLEMNIFPAPCPHWSCPRCQTNGRAWIEICRTPPKFCSPVCREWFWG
jgi:hypothetical protein